jgi:hypothetical protein
VITGLRKKARLWQQLKDLVDLKRQETGTGKLEAHYYPRDCLRKREEQKKMTKGN